MACFVIFDPLILSVSFSIGEPLIKSIGSNTFPTDFDIFLPCPSTTYSYIFRLKWIQPWLIRTILCSQMLLKTQSRSFLIILHSISILITQKNRISSPVSITCKGKLCYWFMGILKSLQPKKLSIRVPLLHTMAACKRKTKYQRRHCPKLMTQKTLYTSYFVLHTLTIFTEVKSMLFSINAKWRFSMEDAATKNDEGPFFGVISYTGMPMPHHDCREMHQSCRFSTDQQSQR